MKKILSIDDEPMMLKCLETTLENKGYEIFVTSDPEEAIQIFTREDIDLVLLDVRMPQKSGFELYTELIQIKATPVLFVTAYPRSFNTDSEEVTDLWMEQFSDGSTDIIYKPFEIEQLYEKVEGLIGTAQEEV